jgi:hypothetical protein
MKIALMMAGTIADTRMDFHGNFQSKAMIDRQSQ